MRISTEINEGKVNDKEAKQIHGRIIRSEKEGKKQYDLTERHTVFFIEFVSATRSTVEMR